MAKKVEHSSLKHFNKQFNNSDSFRSLSRTRKRSEKERVNIFSRRFIDKYWWNSLEHDSQVEIWKWYNDTTESELKKIFNVNDIRREKVIDFILK